MSIKGIVIDAGHGGNDPGASGNNIIEKDLTLKISKYMYDRFKELGVPVKLIRSTDETLDSSARTKRALEAFGNYKDVIVISNHINAGGGEGAEVIYALRNTSTLSEKILNELEKNGQKIRKYFQLRLPSSPSKDYYFMLRDTGKTEALIVEYGFLDNTEDSKRLIENYKQYTEAVIKAICSYIGVTYVPIKMNGYYIVEKGDSLWKIATKYGLTVQKLKELNNIQSTTIKVGDVLKVKDDTNNNNLIYKVKSGDSLWKIASLYNINVEELKKANNLKTNLLQINQELIIPNKTKIIYKVEKGDNLYSIANKYKTTVDKIKQANNLNNNILQINQELIIPND